MRIGQLARRLGIPPSDILGFLSRQNVEAEAGTNSRLGDDALIRVVTHFAPERLSEIVETAPLEAPPVEEPAVEITEVVEEEPAIPVAEESIADLEETPETPLEVIRVSKVELQGLKVLGKIDLPEPKKKAEAAPVEQSEQPRREFQRRTDRRDQREWKNPLELKRQQEARDAEQRRQDEAERMKEQRTNHYHKKVKSVPTKAVRRIEEQTVVEDIEVQEPPKTVLGKFWRWLRT